MASEIEIRLAGEHAETATEALLVKMTELGLEAFRESLGLRFRLLREPEDMEYPTLFELDPNDPPDFAAEKVLDALAEAGLIGLDGYEVSGEEEDEIGGRLRGLGYIE